MSNPERDETIAFARAQIIRGLHENHLEACRQREEARAWARHFKAIVEGRDHAAPGVGLWPEWLRRDG